MVRFPVEGHDAPAKVSARTAKCCAGSGADKVDGRAMTFPGWKSTCIFASWMRKSGDGIGMLMLNGTGVPIGGVAVGNGFRDVLKRSGGIPETLTGEMNGSSLSI